MTQPPSTLPDTFQMREALYVSPSMAIGKHEWCCVVYRHPEYGACTDYHWRKIIPRSWEADFGPERWASQEDWPHYDTNDTYSGLPRRLEKLHLRHRDEIDAALARGKGGAS